MTRAGVWSTTSLTAPIGVVDEVKHFTAELQTVVFADLEALEDAEIPVLKTCSVNQIAISLSGKRSRSRYCENRRPIGIGSSEPIVLVTIVIRELPIPTRELWIAIYVPDLNGSVVVGVILQVPEPPYTRNIITCSYGDWSSSLKLSDTRNLPSTENLS